MTYLVGSAHENYGETGMAHLLEHLVFKGTPRHPNIPQELTAHGSRPNGTTWTDRTNYFETFAATDENLDWALDLEADRMVNSLHRQERSGQRDDRRAQRVRAGREQSVRRAARARDGHVLPLAQLRQDDHRRARPTSRTCRSSGCRRSTSNYYQPDNAVLLIAGKFDEAQDARRSLTSIFSPIPRPTRTLQKIYTAEPTQDGERSVTLRRVGDTQLVQAVYHVPSGSHPDFAGVDMLAQILGDTPSGRLHKALVETKKASCVFGFDFQWRDPTIAIFGAEVRQATRSTRRATRCCRPSKGIGTNPPTKEEVERARAQLLKNIELTLNNSDRVGLTHERVYRRRATGVCSSCIATACAR